jgi:hypothetical protein
MTAISYLSAARPTRSLATESSPGRGAASAEAVWLWARVSAVTFASVLAVAGAVRVALTAKARGWLGYSFPGVPARADVALGIFAHNSRAILGVFGLLLIAQTAARATGGPGPVLRIIRAGGELTLASVIAANGLVVGLALGAYGVRMAKAMLPHGPVELAAYSLALALYLQGRKRALPVPHVVKVAVTSVALLALAAALETFMNV